MRASEAFVNGAGEQRRANRREPERLDLLNTLLSSAVQPGQKSADERQAEEEAKQKPASKPGGFKKLATRSRPA